jgi:protein involved in polysaccharide export with SLBB domain
MLVLVAILTLIVSSVAAQPIKAPVYCIRAGDTLNITVAGHQEWSLQVNVRPDGRITYPATGEINVAGLTLGELTLVLTRALGPDGRHLRDPQVFINVTGMRALVAYVLGSVKKPGAVELPQGIGRLATVLTMAGGITPQGDLAQITLYRGDGTSAIIDLEAELAGDAEHTLIRAGDVLVIPETVARFIGVLGATRQTGQIPLPPREQNINMLDLLVLIGGISERADHNRALILREGGEIESVALGKVLTREIEPPILQDGDVLWVPPEPDQEYFAVTGAVTTAGRFECREGMTLADALALAGQLSEAANPERVMIIHADGEKETLDVLPMLHGEDTELALKPIQPDDIVLVPSRDKSFVVLGAVAKPGFFLWDEDTRLADALAKAGGPVERAAAMGRVVLVRRAAEGGNPTVLQLDARRLLQGDNEAANWKLMPGDTVYVPSKRERDWRDGLANPFSILGIINSLERIFNW